MAVFKCKMCGGVLDIRAGQTTVECDYCSTVQTLPRLDTERRAQLYDRANHHLRNNDYDKAMGMYESILNEDSTDAEAYWMVVLCRFGISYVKDPLTGKYFLTVNRMLKTSIKTDADFKAALTYAADEEQKAIYAQEAAKILAIQQKFDAIYKEEEPFDIFISYKETDENGKRTIDSVIAYDVYQQLTQEGFKVFFSRVTLESILGTEYEPYIFAALNSSKVMIALGTKPEHFNAVWVKNEWSRYLALIHNGEQKALIPAYKDMDAYDLPEEFQHLQAQDMSKLGFMQDLIRGINKLLGRDKPQAPQASSSASATTDSILKRAFMFLDDCDWERAEEYCERVLDIDPENAMAYVGKLMIDLKVNKLEYLGKYKEPFNNNNNYRNAIRFADAKLKSKLTGFNDQIAERNLLAVSELKYAEAIKAFSEGQNTTNSSSERKKYLRTAREAFRQIPDHKDATELRVKCEEQLQLICDTEVYDEAVRLFNGDSAEGVKEAKARFESIKGFKNADEMAAKCDERAVVVEKEQAYARAELRNNGTSFEIEEAIRIYETITDYKDSKEKIEICKQRFTKVKANEEAAAREKERKALAEKRKTKMKKNLKTARKFSKVAVIVGIPIFLVLLFTVILPKNKFNKAVDLFEAKEYEQSYEILCEYDNKVAGEELFEVKYELAEEFEKSEDYFKACVMYDQSNGIKDSKEKYEAMWKIVYDSWEGKAERESVAVSNLFSLGLKNDGTVVAACDSTNGAREVSGWTDIVSVAIGSCSIGLKSDGTVVVSDTSNKNMAKVAEWKYIVAIYAEGGTVAGLRGDGTVITNASGKLGKVDDWEDIVAIDLSTYVIVGLKSDGTAVAAGKNKKGECNVQGWSDIIDIDVYNQCVVGLKKDGTVVATGATGNMENINEVDDAVYISAGYSYVLVLRENGKLVSSSNNTESDFAADWSGLEKIYQQHSVIFGVTHDGRVGVAAYEGEYQNEAGKWENIEELYIADSIIVGRKTDGSFVSVSYSEFNGNGTNYAAEVDDWTDIKVY